MKRYIIKNADGSEQNVMPAVHSTRREAGNILMDYIDNYNERLSDDDDRYLTPFDFMLEEVESEVNEVITDFKSAKCVLDSSRFILAKDSFWFKNVELNIRHYEALSALNQLFTIAEAWNKEDEFVPNFKINVQDKWFPIFKYNYNISRFVYERVANVPADICASFGQRLFFKTSKRAEQFGKQFTYLYNKVLCL